jgi:eukaryotic-like serine/threonine-protein kinase
MSRALGRYELLRPLARGGMGEVYLARRRAAGVEKWLVVKRMRPERAGDARFLDLFMREARLSMSLAHQNIVPVFDFGRIDDQVFLAMERVEGKDLGSSLGRSASAAVLTPMLAAFIAAECCQALDYAHRRRGPDGALLGIVHRDVTPRNVLLSWSGEVKLTDFGIAALAHDVIGARSVIGTPAYMAPEQARGDATDARADVYAVGLVLREAWTGKRARGGSDREATMAMARDGVLEPWPEGFDGPLRAIVDKATAAAPGDRYPDARAMLEELDAFIVVERSAKKGDGPARQLAAWLAATWQGERDDAASEEPIEGQHLVSFLDDGALDVAGTGTQRSMAATAAEEAPAPPPEPAPAPVVSPPPRRRWWLAATPLPVIALGAWLMLRSPAHDAPIEKLPAPAPVVAPVVPPAPQPVEIKHPVVEAPRPPPVVKKKPPAPKLVTPVVPAPVVVKHRALIGSKPWSYFTVDTDPTRYVSNNAIQLAPGHHTIHFVGQEHFAADQKLEIDMPDADGFRTVVPLTELTPPAP